MKSKMPWVVAAIVLAYAAYVGMVLIFYQPSVDNMSWEDRQAYNQSKLAELKLGLSSEHIHQLMGSADFSEAKFSQGKALTILFYRTHQTKSDGITTRDECTPLLFSDDKLIGWGQDTYQQYLAALADQPTEASAGLTASH